MPSIVDVAKMANVSITTVSRVLSGNPHPVSEETRGRVLDAARALNYSPSALAQALVTRDTHIVGVIVGDAMDPYFAAIVRGVEDVARQAGYLVIVCNSDRIPAIELNYLNTLNDYRVDGIIFAGGGLVEDNYLREVNRAIEVFYEREAVCVSLGKQLFPACSVIVDNERVVQDATDYLIRLGHTEIAYISGPSLLTTSELRLNGYRRSLGQHGLPFKPDYVLSGAYTYDSGLQAAQALHRLADGPTAILASNDLMAIGCIVRLRELGYQIPADMSVMGIDDITPAQFVVPSLTTMALSLYDLGKVGMESLIGLRNGEKSVEDVITLPHRLVVRQSTGSAQRTNVPRPPARRLAEGKRL